MKEASTINNLILTTLLLVPLAALHAADMDG
jgi:hypothetical protein